MRRKHATFSGAELSFSRRAHLLPYHWSQLSPGERAEISDKLRANPKGVEGIERQARLAVSLLMSAGNRLADIYDLKIFPGAPEQKAGHPGIFLNSGKTPLLRLPAGLVRRSGRPVPQDLNENQSRKRSVQPFLTPVGQPPSQWPSIDGEPRAKFEKRATNPKRSRIHPLSPTPGRQGPFADHEIIEFAVPRLVLAYLRDIEGHGPTRLFDIPLDDLWIAVKAFLTDREGGHARRRVARGVTPLERSRWNELFLSPGGHDVDASRQTNTALTPNLASSFYGRSPLPSAAEDRRAFRPGSRRTVDDELIQDVTRKAREALKACSPQLSFDALADYSATMICFATGHRATFDHLPSLAAIDLKSKSSASPTNQPFSA